MSGSEVVHPHWCERSECHVGEPGVLYATHRSQPVVGCADPDTGSLIDVTLWTINGGKPNILLEFPDGVEEGTELTEDQAADLVAAVSRMLAVARG
ncbi:hypothetical protein ACQEVZ_20420 [Dactylosporangium sp. CA-152071]|uniref:hypothetical protein n=1 Tax=Dactylosporangium sp. CA-152071 TaxID=3239933 RepID=UPI003D91C2B2